MSAMSISAAGMSTAVDRYQASADRTAQLGTDLGRNVDPAMEAAEQISDATAFEANAAVIRVSSDMDKRLLDIKV